MPFWFVMSYSVETVWFCLFPQRIIYLMLTHFTFIVHCVSLGQTGPASSFWASAYWGSYWSASVPARTLRLWRQWSLLFSRRLKVLGHRHEVFRGVCDDLFLRCRIYWMQDLVQMSEWPVYAEKPMCPLSSHLLGVQRAWAVWMHYLWSWWAKFLPHPYSKTQHRFPPCKLPRGSCYLHHITSILYLQKRNTKSQV